MLALIAMIEIDVKRCLHIIDGMFLNISKTYLNASID